MTIKYSETKCVSFHHLYRFRFIHLTLMSDFIATQLKKVEPYLKKLGLEADAQNFTGNVINIIKTKKKYNIVFMDVLHNIITHNQCTEYDEVLDLYYSLKPSMLIIKALSTTLYMLPFLNNEQLKKLFVFNLAICNRKHEREVATIAQATTIQMVTTIRDERTDDLPAIIDLLDEKNVFNLKLLKEVIAHIDKPVNLRFESDDWDYKKEAMGLIDERNKFKVDIDYFMMYYDKNEEIILSAFLGCNRHNINKNGQTIRNMDDQVVKLNQHILKDNDDVIKLLEPCIKNITFVNSPINTLRFIFIYTVCQKYRTNTTNYVELLAEKYEKSCYDTYVVNIVGIVIKSCLLDGQKKNKIDFKQFNENLSGSFASNLTNEGKYESVKLDGGNEADNAEEGCSVASLDVEHDHNKSDDEDNGEEWHEDYEIDATRTLTQDNEENKVSSDICLGQNKNDDDVALINPLLLFFVKAFPKETIDLISPLQLNTSWPIVINNLSDAHILTLFTKHIVDLSNFILYNNRFVKEMYFATFKNLCESDFRNILFKLELYECESVVLEYYRKNDNEDVIMDYLTKRLQPVGELSDMTPEKCLKSDYIERSDDEADYANENNSSVLIDNNNLILKIVYQLIKIKVFRNLDFIFTCLANSTNNSLKLKILGIISKKEQSTRLIKSIFCVAMDRNINLALAALELIRSVELNDTTYLYSLITLINDERLDVYDTAISILFSVLNGRMVEGDLVDECIGEVVNRMERICFRKEYNGFESRNDSDVGEDATNNNLNALNVAQNVNSSGNNENNSNYLTNDGESCVEDGTKTSNLQKIVSRTFVRKDLVDSHQIYEKFLLSSYLTPNMLSPRQEKSVKFTFSELINFLYLHQSINLSDSFFVFLSELFLKCAFICENVIDFMLEYRKTSYVLFVCYLRMVREVGMGYKDQVYEKMLKLFFNFLNFNETDTANDFSNIHINTPGISRSIDAQPSSVVEQPAKLHENVENDRETEFSIAGVKIKKSEITDLLHSLSRFRNYEVLQITKTLPQDIVLPFYMDWLPDPKIIEVINDGSQFSTECLNKLMRIKMNWEEKAGILQNLKIEEDNLETFIENSTEVMIEGFDSLENERFMSSACYSSMYGENNGTSENNTANLNISHEILSKRCDREKEKIIICYLTKYYEILRKHKKLDSKSLQVFYHLSKVKKSNINVSFHAYNYLFKIKPDYLCTRIKEAICEYLVNLIKYEHLFNRCKRDEIIYILDRMDRETTLMVGKSIIELLKCKDLEVIEKVYCVLKSIY